MDYSSLEQTDAQLEVELDKVGIYPIHIKIIFNF